MRRAAKGCERLRKISERKESDGMGDEYMID